MALFLAVASSSCAHAPAPDHSIAATRALSRSPVFDGHNDLAIHYAGAAPIWSSQRLSIAAGLPGQSDIPRMRAGRVGGALITVSSALDPAAKEHFAALARSFDWFDRLVTDNGGSLAKARSSTELASARQSGRLGFMMAIEGGDQVDGSLGNLRTAYARGVRSMLIVYDYHNVIGDGANAFPSAAAIGTPATGGLTCFGRQVIGEMNRLGMIVDLSHAAQSTAEQAMAISTAPVIFSHSGARALADTPRNLSDPTLAMLRRNGGVVMVPLVPYLTTHAAWRWYFAGEANYALLRALYPGDEARVSREATEWDHANRMPIVRRSDVADQVEYVARQVGRDKVGIGSDFDGMGRFVIPELADARLLPALFVELARRGWNEAQLAGLASRNFERVLKAVEKESRRLRASPNSSRPARTRPC